MPKKKTASVTRKTGRSIKTSSRSQVKTTSPYRLVGLITGLFLGVLICQNAWQSLLLAATAGNMSTIEHWFYSYRNGSSLIAILGITTVVVFAYIGTSIGSMIEKSVKK